LEFPNLSRVQTPVVLVVLLGVLLQIRSQKVLPVRQTAVRKRTAATMEMTAGREAVATCWVAWVVVAMAGHGEVYT
jgi:hypothetical protein